MATSAPQTNLDDFLHESNMGPLRTAVSNNFYGINHLQQPTPILMNRDNHGFTFFVRPQLNFQSPNLRNVRALGHLLTNNPNSYSMINRCTLDPRLQMVDYSDNPMQSSILDCPFVDKKQAFIPLLTNHLNSISGWPDLSSPTASSKEGAYNEAHTMVDGIVVNYTAYDITATFRNSRGDPIMALFNAWVNYQSCVMEGTLMPYPDFMIENEIDYNTRIYRIVLDNTKSVVQKIGATGAAFPSSLPIGASFDYDNKTPYNEANTDISIRFSCNGAEYDQSILIYEFNKTVGIFNSDMRDDAINSNMVPVPQKMLSLFNNRAYPRIDPITNSFTWYVSKELYLAKQNALQIFQSTN
jgi:hypothetical protein